VWVNKPERIYETLEIFNGVSKAEIDEDLKNKQFVLKQLCDKQVTDVNIIGNVMAKYYLKRIHG
jgi:hypothetical protein